MNLDAVPIAAEPDRLARFGSRDRLLADLAAAMKPGAEEKALVIFGFDGFRELVRRLGRPESQSLLGGLSAQLELELGSASLYYLPYWPREDEFAVLCDAGSASLERVLNRATQALCDRGRPASVTAAFGKVVVPAEASDPIAALRLADERLTAAQPGREPREHRAHLHAVPFGDHGEAGVSERTEPAAPPASLWSEMVEASAGSLRRWRVDQLLDVAGTLTLFADAARTDGAVGGLQGQPRDAARIPLLLKELGLKLTALDVLGGADLPAARALADEAGPRVANAGARALAALDEIDAALAAA